MVKKLKQKNKTLFAIVCFLFVSCSYKNCEDKSKLNSKTPLSFYHIEDTVYNLSSFDDFNSFIERKPIVSEFFFETNNSLKKKTELFNLINNIYFDSLYFEVKNTFKSFNLKKKEFEDSFSRLKVKLPQISIPKITTIVSGFYNDIVVVDNNIIIGLDYFLDEDSRFKPQDIPEYILKRYNPDNLIPITMSVYCSQFNKTNPLDNTMISEMLNFGKLYYLLQSILPCVNPYNLIGYSQEEWNLINQNEETIYGVFVDRQLFFETNHLIKNKYLSERPKTFEISPNCPGRIGAWLGWRIVESYMKNNTNITIQELLNNTNNKEIFFQSLYKPG